MEAPGSRIKAFSTIRQRLPALSGACTERQPVTQEVVKSVPHRFQFTHIQKCLRISDEQLERSFLVRKAHQSDRS